MGDLQASAESADGGVVSGVAELLAALPFLASVVIGAGLLAALAMAGLALLAFLGLAINLPLAQLDRVPRIRRRIYKRLSFGNLASMGNLLLLRVTRRVPALGIYLGLLLFVVVLAAVLVQAQHPGLNQPGADPDPARAWWNAIYRGLTLLAFGADWTLPAATPPDGAVTGPPLSPELQAIRFGLPILAIGGLFVTLIKGAGHWLQLQIMPRYGHTVLCGLGEAGTAYVQHLTRLRDLMRHGPIVVVERDGANPNVALCRGLGIPVVIDDVLDESGRALRRARVRRAERVIGLLREDAANVQFVMRVQQVLAGPSDGLYARLHRRIVRWIGWTPPRVIAQVNDPQLAHRLENYEKVTQVSRADVRFYNIHAIQAQQLILRYPPDQFADLFAESAPHIAIYGFGRLGQQVFAEAVRLCQYMPGDPPRFTILDRDAGRVRRVLEQEFPEIARDSECARQVAVVRDIVEVEVDPPALGEATLRELFADRGVVTQHVICFGDEAVAVSLALALRDQLLERRGANAPIFVRTKRARGMAALLDSNSGRREIPDGLYPFATLETALEPRALDNGWLEAMAQVLHHYGYLNEDPDTGLARPADQPWERLDDLHRRGTRHAVLHTDAKLRAHGLKRFPRPGGMAAGARDCPLPQLFCGDTARKRVATTQAEPQPALEHRRYVAARLADGWQQASSRIDALRRHTAFVPYDELRGDMQRNDRRMTAVLPAAVTGDRALVMKKARAAGAQAANDAAGGMAVAAFETLASRSQTIRPERRIGVIGPIGLCAGPPPTPDPVDLEGKIETWLAGADPFADGCRSDALATRGVRLVAPLLHRLERRAVQELYRRLTGGRLAAGRSPEDEPDTFWARRVEVAGLLPLPYDFLRARSATVLLGAPELGPGCPDPHRLQAEEEAFWDLLGAAPVRYTEMPLLAAPGCDLAVPPAKPERDDDGVVQPLARGKYNLPKDAAAQRWYAQWRLTAAYLFRRCDEVILIRDPEGGPDGLEEIAGWRHDSSRIPDRPGWAATKLFPPPGTQPAEPVRSGAGLPVVEELFGRGQTTKDDAGAAPGSGETAGAKAD